MPGAVSTTSREVTYLSTAAIPSRTAHSMHVMKMCQAMVQEGHGVDLIARRPGGSQSISHGELLAHYGIRDEFPIHLLGGVKSLRGVDYDVRCALRTRRAKSSVAYSRNLRLAGLLSVLGRSVIYEAHDMPGGVAGPWYFSRMVRAGGLRGVVAISESLRDALLEKYRRSLAEDRVLVAHDGVDLERFDDLPAGRQAKEAVAADPEKYMVGYAGHLYTGRGIDLILKLAKRFPEFDFLMVGGDPATVAERKEELAGTGLSNVRYRGFVPNADLPNYLAACDVLLMPYQRRVSVSSGGDTASWMSPMKMFEYMASGRPILSSDLPVLREVLNDTNSVLCEPEDVGAWAAALRRLSGSEESAKQLASRARSDVQRYTWRRRVGQIFDAFLGDGPSQPESSHP